MKTTLHYQMKDFRRFVLDDLEKQGYVLAAGTDLMLADLEGVDDPEAVVMEVLVEDRPVAHTRQLESQSVLPTAQELFANVTTGPKQNQDEGLSEKELAKKEAKRAYWREKAQAKRAKKQGASQTAVEPVNEQVQEVVAPSPLPFPGGSNSSRAG